MSFESFENAKYLDVFSELGNIGAGNATTALSQMLDRKIDLKVPVAAFVPFSRVTEIIGDPESVVVSGLVEITGDLQGFVLLVQSEADAARVAQSLLGESEPVASALEFNEMQLSALKEVTNILTGAYITAITSLTEMDVKIEPPQIAVDMAAAVMSVPAVEYGKLGETVLFIETTFIDMDYALTGHFFLVPDYASTGKMLSALGIGADE